MKKRKVINIILNILMYTFLFLSLVMLVFTIATKKDKDDSITIFGYQTRLVISESMEKCSSTYDQIKKYQIKDIPVKSLLLIKTIPEDSLKQEKFISNLKIGDVLTFKYVIGTKQETITHRVIDIRNSEEGKIIELRGDNVLSNINTNTTSQIINTDDLNSPNYIIGKVVGKSYLLGSLLFSLKQPLGMALIIIVPSLIIMVIEIVKIVNYIYTVKKKKAEEELTESKKELEELKQKLKDLEKLEVRG